MTELEKHRTVILFFFTGLSRKVKYTKGIVRKHGVNPGDHYEHHSYYATDAKL